jgi:hypothetical protein
MTVDGLGTSNRGLVRLTRLTFQQAARLVTLARLAVRPARQKPADRGTAATRARARTGTREKPANRTAATRAQAGELALVLVLVLVLQLEFAANRAAAMRARQAAEVGTATTRARAAMRQ